MSLICLLLLLFISYQFPLRLNKIVCCNVRGTHKISGSPEQLFLFFNRKMYYKCIDQEPQAQLPEAL